MGSTSVDHNRATIKRIWLQVLMNCLCISSAAAVSVDISRELFHKMEPPSDDKLKM